MLAALSMALILSHAFRTAGAISSDPLAVEFHTSAQALGAVAFWGLPRPHNLTRFPAHPQLSS